MERLNTLEQYEQRTPEWFSQRENFLSSSKVGTILGLDKYNKPTDVLFEYCGIKKPFTPSPACDHGNHYEDEAITYWGNAINGVNNEFGLIPYSAIPYEQLSDFGKSIRDEFPVEEYYFLGGSPDGIMKYSDGREGVIEAKCPYRRKIKFGEIPDYYFPQCMLNLLYCDCPFTDYIEYYPEGHMSGPSLNAVRIYQDREYFRRVLPLLKEFWTEVEHYRMHGIETHPEYEKYRKKYVPERVLNLK
jgi:putative phage-type endonuclease